MAIVLDVLSWSAIVAGSFFAVVGGIGLVRLPDFYCRMHAGGVTDTAGAGLILLGLMFQAGLSPVTVKLLMILFLLLVTSPTSAHAVAKSALAHGLKPLIPSRGEALIEHLAPIDTQWIDLLILALLAATAFTIVRMRSLFAAAMLSGIYSFLGASWMLVLDAPDVAFTEASVGAGIGTVLMLGTLALTTREESKPHRRRLLGLLVVSVTGAVLLLGTIDMPYYGDPGAPVHEYPRPTYVERSPEEIQVPNVVTAVLASYRGYDTLGETVVILTAGFAVLALLRGRRSRRDERERR